MTSIIIYFLLALSATSIGSLAGIGGGVIIKPLMDLLNDFSVQSINLLSSLTVLTMSIVSVSKQLLSRNFNVDLSITIPLAIGAAIGGLLGRYLFALLLLALPLHNTITLIQNAFLLLLLIAVFLFMHHRHKFSFPSASGFFPSLLTGLSLGALSSFLGIGGGPFNIAVIVSLFNFNIKDATLASLVCILFSQFANSASTALSGGFVGIDFSIFPVLAPAAVLGGFIGSALNRRLDSRAVERAFSLVQCLVIAITISNIVRALSSLLLA